jgi:hypothetical protein
MHSELFRVGSSFMSVNEYRHHALECFRIAEVTADSRCRITLLNMAQSWLLLAQQAEKNLSTNLVYETPPRFEARSPAVAQQQQQQVQPKKKEE